MYIWHYQMFTDIEKDSVNALKVIREGLALYPNDLRVFLQRPTFT